MDRQPAQSGTPCEQQIADVRVKTSSADASITSLSGGNQQKVVIGKVLLTKPRVILLDEPSRGIDVGAKAEIFGLMAREARRGLAVLFATSEVSEALSVSNRIVVMSKGRIIRVARFRERDRAKTSWWHPARPPKTNSPGAKTNEPLHSRRS